MIDFDIILRNKLLSLTQSYKSRIDFDIIFKK